MDKSKYESFTKMFEKHTGWLNYVDLNSQVQKILEQFLAKFPQFKIKHSEEILKLSEFRSFFQKTNFSNSTANTYSSFISHSQFFDQSKKSEFLDKLRLFLINKKEQHQIKGIVRKNENEYYQIENEDRFIQCLDKMLAKKYKSSPIDTTTKQYKYLYSKECQNFLDTYLRLQKDTPQTYIAKSFKSFLKKNKFNLNENDDQSIDDDGGEDDDDEIDEDGNTKKYNKKINKILDKFLNSPEMENFYAIFVEPSKNNNSNSNLQPDECFKIMLKQMLQKNQKKFLKDPKKFLQSKKFKDFINNFQAIQTNFSPFDFFKSFIISNKQCIKNVDDLKANPLFQMFLQYNSGGQIDSIDKFFDSFFAQYPELKDKYPESVLLSQQFATYYQNYITKQNNSNKKQFQDYLNYNKIEEERLEKLRLEEEERQKILLKEQEEQNEMEQTPKKECRFALNFDGSTPSKLKISRSQYMRRLHKFNTVVTPFGHHANTMKYLDLPFINKNEVKKGLQEENIIMLFSPKLTKRKAFEF